MRRATFGRKCVRCVLNIQFSDKSVQFSLKAEHTKPPLYLMEVVCIGNLTRKRDVLKPIIEKMGGKLVTKIHPKTIVILSTESEVEKMNKRMQEAQENNVQVCDESFLNEIQNGSNGDTLEYIKNNSICDWGSDVSEMHFCFAGEKINFIFPIVIVW